MVIQKRLFLSIQVAMQKLSMLTKIVCSLLFNFKLIYCSSIIHFQCSIPYAPFILLFPCASWRFIDEKQKRKRGKVYAGDFTTIKNIT